MSLLREVQSSILQPESDIGSVLLKLRLLASRLGSPPLEEWIKYESEGYPMEVEVPNYRQINVVYYGTWMSPVTQFNNVPIPTHLIEKYAGTSWVTIPVRQSIAAINALATGDGDEITIDASNLILLLQGKVYKNLSCVAVDGKISQTAMKEIQSVVRSRVLELTVEIEKAVPNSTDVTLDSVGAERNTSDHVTQIFNQTVFGTNTTVAHGQLGTQINLAIGQGDVIALVSELIRAGIPKVEAQEFAQLLASEKPDSPENPFGKRTLRWLRDNIEKAAGGSWNIGIGVAVKVLEEAALRITI